MSLAVLTESSGGLLLETAGIILYDDPYLQACLVDSPISLWAFGETTGTNAADLMGLNAGTYVGTPTLNQTGPTVGDTGNKAVTFNGSSQAATAPINLSAYTAISLEFWLWWDAFADDDDLAFEFTSNGASVAGGFLVDPNASNGSRHKFNFGMASGTGPVWFDEFTRPSAAAWHHYVLTMNRATPVQTAYVDGVAQTLATTQHDAGTYGSFANSTLYFMSRTATALFGAGRLAKPTVYGSVLSGARVLAHYNAGVTA